MKGNPSKDIFPKKTLAIAGSESGGTAGIQADLKTFSEIGVYGMCTITAIVGRHPVTDKNVHPIEMEVIEAQFYTALQRSNGIDALKIGMLFSTKVIERVAALIKENPFPYVVLDPVMIGKLDSKLLSDDAIGALKTQLIPLASIITPNMAEAAELLGIPKIQTVEELAQAAKDLHKLGSQYVLVKGGRLKDRAVDVLYDGKRLTYYETQRTPTQNTSGAGCSYSSAIAAYLAKGYDMEEAVFKAKRFVATAIAHSFSFTDNPGPINHLANRNKENWVEVKKYF